MRLLLARCAIALAVSSGCAAPQYGAAPLFPDRSEPRAMRPEVPARDRAGVTVGRPTFDLP